MFVDAVNVSVTENIVPLNHHISGGTGNKETIAAVLQNAIPYRDVVALLNIDSGGIPTIYTGSVSPGKGTTCPAEVKVIDHDVAGGAVGRLVRAANLEDSTSFSREIELGAGRGPFAMDNRQDSALVRHTAYGNWRISGTHTVQHPLFVIGRRAGMDINCITGLE